MALPPRIGPPANGDQAGPAATPDEGGAAGFARLRGAREVDPRLQPVLDEHRRLARIRAEQAGRVDPTILQAEATARATAGHTSPIATRSIARALPPGVQQAARPDRVINPKIWEQDLPPRIDHKRDWRQAKRALTRYLGQRRPGDPLRNNLDKIVNALIWKCESERCGYARMTHEAIARWAGVCNDTVRRSIRFLERVGLVDTVNVVKRERTAAGDQVHRTANVYLLRLVEDPNEGHPAATMQPLLSDAAPGLARITGVLQRWAGVLGLEARTFGWNRWPVPSRAQPP